MPTRVKRRRSARDSPISVEYELAVSGVLGVSAMNSLPAPRRGTRTSGGLRLKASVFESSREGILIASAEGIIVAANQAFAALSGYKITQLVGMTVDALRSASHGVETFTKTWPVVQTDDHWVGETLCRKKNGEDQPIELSIVGVRNGHNGAAFYTYTCADVAGRAYAQARIQHMAFFDSLTGLPNRAYLIKRFESLAAAVSTIQRPLAVVFLDLDGFKEVNDTFGHSAGDVMIVQLVQRICADVSRDTLVCRFGGDEFILILPDHDEAQATRFMRELLVRISLPVALEGREIAVTASAGISIFPKDGADVENLVRYADTALYYAKANGKNTIVSFNPEMEVALSRRFDLLAALRSAIDRDEFVLRFQPIMDTANATIVACEALVYWEHPRYGTIGPSTFIPLAEESGLIEAVGEWVMDEALAHYAMWETRGMPKLGLAINISGFQVRRLEAIEKKIRTAVAAGVIDPHKLTLEITERHFVHNLKSGLPVLQSLSAIGVGLAIDDFGTGYSNLNYLKDLPITEIKIDISFIRNLVRDVGDRVIVKSIVDLSRSLHLDVVAEGVETAEQLEILLEYGCNHVQGFLFSRPIPADEFVSFVLHHAQATVAPAAAFPRAFETGDAFRSPATSGRRRDDRKKRECAVARRSLPVTV
jgi:diguanylate cyclase (GGDEF)-like protein/PAS domain S-box-containing protein